MNQIQPEKQDLPVQANINTRVKKYTPFYPATFKTSETG
jgi:hypothetical protein